MRQHDADSHGDGQRPLDRPDDAIQRKFTDDGEGANPVRHQLSGGGQHPHGDGGEGKDPGADDRVEDPGGEAERGAVGLSDGGDEEG